MRAYLGLGGNLGDRRANMQIAARTIGKHLPITAVSSLYETAPVGFQDQPAFLNAVIEVAAQGNAFDLYQIARAVEGDLGRQRTFANAPRTIDIDVLLYGAQVIEEPDLEIPHPRMHNRAFVLVPLGELAPDLVHPVLGRSISDLLEALGDTSADVWPIAGQGWIDAKG